MTAKNIREAILRAYQNHSGGEALTKKAAPTQMQAPRAIAAVKIR